MKVKEKGVYTPAPRDWTLPDRATSYYKELVAIYGASLAITDIADYLGQSYNYVSQHVRHIRRVGGTNSIRAMDVAAWLVDRELAKDRHERAKKAARA